jgi:hypothetical protein
MIQKNLLSIAVSFFLFSLISLVTVTPTYAAREINIDTITNGSITWHLTNPESFDEGAGRVCNTGSSQTKLNMYNFPDSSSYPFLTCDDTGATFEAFEDGLPNGQYTVNVRTTPNNRSWASINSFFIYNGTAYDASSITSGSVDITATVDHENGTATVHPSNHQGAFENMNPSHTCKFFFSPTSWSGTQPDVQTASCGASSVDFTWDNPGLDAYTTNRNYILQISDYTSGSINTWGSAETALTLPSSPEAKIEAAPSSGNKNVGVPFTVNVTVNGDNQTFNAARASIAVSSNLTVNSISSPTTNACNFHYTKTPTTNNPSFAGAIYGDSSENCNVYTMVLTPNATGNGTITITNGSIKSYEDSSELLNDVTNASFTLSNQPTPTPTSLMDYSVTSPLITYKENFLLKGEKVPSLTHIFVNGSEDDSTYPTSTTWQAPVTLTLGNNTISLYGSDNGTNQIAPRNIIINRHTLGDINGDGNKDLIDASLFAVDWDKTEGLTYILSDMNDDGTVNLTDLSILAKLQE